MKKERKIKQIEVFFLLPHKLRVIFKAKGNNIISCTTNVIGPEFFFLNLNPDYPFIKK